MERICEPEIMDETEQVEAYARADFEKPHSLIIGALQELLAGKKVGKWGLDLGCGSGDMIVRLLRAFPEIHLEAVDGSPKMLAMAESTLREKGLLDRTTLTHGVLPDATLSRNAYDLIFSSSLLHHLHDPDVLWRTVRKYGKRGTFVFISDLIRPPSREEARRIVEEYSGEEPEVLKRDFFNSLLAAFTPKEVRKQLDLSGLSSLTVKIISDRHMAVFGSTV